MKPLNSTARRRVTLIVVSILALVGYLLADRYLIEHVEIANVSTYLASITLAATSTPLAQAETQVTSISLPLSTSQESSTQTSETSTALEDVYADDWTYQSDDYSIQITQVTAGSGRNTVTYFVADVRLTGAAQLNSAFAENSFGRNIIAYTSEIAEENNAIFAINGDYYGFRSDGIEIRNGVVYRDEPARTGLAFYLDGTMRIYDETQTSAEELLAEGVWNTLSFGPALVEDGQIASGLDDVEIDTNFGNHSIQGNNPRTGVGIIAPNHFIFVVVDGRSSGYSRGVSLTEFAQIFKGLGCSEAYNIDGGGSSTMYFMGRVVNNPLGRNKERGTSDILFIS